MAEQNLISVILPVYNAGKFLSASIESILNQTHRNFELIILNDGSTDESEQIVKSFNDPRIRYFEHPNMGLANTLNKGIALSAGEFIARQDNDDISYPDRLKLQLDFLKNNPQFAIVGSHARIVNENGIDTGRKHTHPLKSCHLKFDLVFDNPFVHSSVMFRKQLIQDTGNYISDSNFFEDHNLWSRVSRNFKVANIPEILLDYREVSTGMSKSAKTYSDKVIFQTIENLNYYLPNDSEVNLKCANIYHEGFDNNSDKEVLSEQAKKLISIIFENESESEKINALKRFILKVEINNLRNNYKNLGHSGFQKLKMKFKRRSLFSRYNKLISTHQF